MKTVLAFVGFWFLGIGAAHAVFGVGDITFDPPVHAELVSLFEQTLAVYHTLTAELDRLRIVQATLQEGERNARAVTNGSLLRYARAGLPPGVPPSIAPALARAHPRVPARTGARALDSGRARRLRALWDLTWLTRGAHHDMRLASRTLGEKASADVTAQSTSALALLAAAREKRALKRALRHAAERRNDRRLPREAQSLYRAFGHTP